MPQLAIHVTPSLVTNRPLGKTPLPCVPRYCVVLTELGKRDDFRLNPILAGNCSIGDRRLKLRIESVWRDPEHPAA